MSRFRQLTETALTNGIYMRTYVHNTCIHIHLLSFVASCHKGVKRPLHFNCILHKFAFGKFVVVCMMVLKSHMPIYI